MRRSLGVTYFNASTGCLYKSEIGRVVDYMVKLEMSDKIMEKIGELKNNMKGHDPENIHN